MLEVFFFSWLWASLREFPRVSILSTMSQVINHFPEVSAKSSGRSGKVVVSLSLLHYEIVDNDEQKGDRDSPPPPPPPRRSLVMTSKSLVRWPSTYTALLKLVYRAIEVSSYSSGFRFVRNIPVKDGDLAVIYRYEYVTSHLFIKSKYFQAVVS